MVWIRTFILLKKGTNNIPRKLDKYEVENSKKDAMDGMDRL